MLNNQHLIAQWRECRAIKKQWEEGILKHRLVSYVKDYDKELFLNYVYKVVKEMKSRKIKFNNDLFDDIFIFCNPENNWVHYEQIPNYPEHNDRYLLQNYYNLQEKFDRNIISADDWALIRNKVSVAKCMMNYACEKKH